MEANATTRRMKKFVILSLYLISVYGSIAQNCQTSAVSLDSISGCSGGEYRLVFEDNFDGNSLDMDKWDIPWQGEMNDYDHERSNCWLANHGSTPNLPYTNNIEVSDGTLKLIAKRENPPIAGTIITDMSTTPWTTRTDYYDYSSAWIQTKQQYFYGKYEIRCRLPEGRGFWPAFWVYGGKKWNEIDFFEIHDKRMDTYTCNVLHDFDNTPGQPDQCPYSDNNAADFTDWHTFTCFFEVDRIVFQLDGVTQRTVFRYTNQSGDALLCGDNSSDSAYLELEAFPAESMNIIMNLSVQSGRKAPNRRTRFPASYEIDYIRYWTRQ